MKNEILIPIGRRMAEIRRAHSMSQEELAEKLEVTPKHISHVECGTSSLSIKNLIEFCNIFNCSLDYIILDKTDTTLNKLSPEIVTLLNTESNNEIQRLNRFLQVYIELANKQA